jgi:DNA polymerase I-like protein with 3'-5' exonuclease and polymerase domains
MKLIAFDIETWGLKEGYALQPWRIKTGEGGIICVSAYPDISELITNDNALWCGWNLKFDTAWLMITEDPNIKYPMKGNKYLDGMLLLKRLFQDLPTYALKPTLERFQDQIDFSVCGQAYIIGYQNHIEFKVGRMDEVYTSRELELLQLYCERDTAYTYALIKYLLTLADRNTVLQTIRESTVSVLFADAWQRGLPIDKKEVLKQEKEISKQLKKYNDVLEKTGLTETILNSPKQLREFLQGEWGIKLTKLTPKGDYSVDASVLKNLAFQENSSTIKKILQIMVKRKELQTEYDKFISSALECLKESEVIHPEPMMNSTYTGRMTYSVNQAIKTQKILKNGKIRTSNTKTAVGLPIHQMKRGNLRKMFIAPKGYKLVELDFAAQEMRLIACIAPEPTMVDLFNSDSDLHAYTAAGIYNYEFNDFQKLKGTDDYKEMRQLGKVTNLSLQYRLSAKNLYRVWHDKYELIDKKLEDAERARNVYLEIYKGILNYWQDIVNFARSNGYVTNMAGRKHNLTSWNGEDEWKSQQTAINFPIQSTGAEQKILALFELRKLMRREGVQLAWDLHDGMYFFVPDGVMQDDVILEMVDIASNLNYEKAWGWHPQVKFPVEAKIGDNWADLKIV